jgi:uncharacterized circularly permuted ATP-grasp superfamily protein/uncharacterized alpha-E superfamily protein
MKHPPTAFDEVLTPGGEPREVYCNLFERLRESTRAQLQSINHQLEAAMREMGVSFDVDRDRPWGKRPWFCDLLPQIFTPGDWTPLAEGIRQRIHAFELFRRDIYSEKQILRDGVIPVATVLGSHFFQRPAHGLPLPGGSFLHLSGVAACRLPDGTLAIKHHYMSHASGMSYMIQNRRVLTRVIPQSFQETGIHSISDVPTDILEMLRNHSSENDPLVVLLTPGPLSPAYSEHGFLSRRMGIPLVQGGDLLVMNDEVYLKTVRGLNKVDVIYSRVSDQWLDPLVFQRDSVLGVPGLVHCIRKKNVSVVNAIGAQLSDDRALLPHASRIIRYYLGQNPLLPTLETFWLGDIDQREHVLANLSDFTIRPLYGERILSGGDRSTPCEESLAAARSTILENPTQYVAQPRCCDATTVSFQKGERHRRHQDHILFAIRNDADSVSICPGALTRVATAESGFTASELGGGGKDTWVQVDLHEQAEEWDATPQTEFQIPSHGVTSRVAEAFYWIGRYLERAYDLAGMVGVIESLELEELNPTERMNYRPVWNKILPMLESAAVSSRRTISSPEGRHRLTLDTAEPGSVVSTILRAVGNAESVVETLSIDAWGVLSNLREQFEEAKFDPSAPADVLAASSRSLCRLAREMIPQFFGTAERSMLSDDGWNFCRIGQFIERGAITANAASSITGTLLQSTAQNRPAHALEIRLSAFLRLLNCRDVYRRVYQMRIEPEPMLDLLWKNPVAPRSVLHCLNGCAALVRESENSLSPATERALAEMEHLIQAILSTDWSHLLRESTAASSGKSHLQIHSEHLLDRLLALHTVICDSFLNHQVLTHHETRPLFPN